MAKDYTQEALGEQLKEEIKQIQELGETNGIPMSELGLDMSEFINDNTVTPYTTEVLEKIQELEPTLTSEQIQDLVKYVKGGARPEFVDVILTQTNSKLSEMLKIMTVLQLLQLPALYDYLSVLQKNLLKPESIKNMSYADISAEAVNIQKEINDILQMGLKVTAQIQSENQIPTKVEKLANALMGCSDSTRKRIEEIIADDIEE